MWTRKTQTEKHQYKSQHNQISEYFLQNLSSHILCRAEMGELWGIVCECFEV